MGNISKDFSFSDFSRSEAAAAAKIENTIPAAVRPAIVALVENVLQPLRDYGLPLKIVSGYRCAKLNEHVGGAKSSPHLKGEAVDIRSPFYVPVDIARWIKMLKVPFDQMTVHAGYVHLSYKKSGLNREKITYDARYGGEKI